MNNILSYFYKFINISVTCRNNKYFFHYRNKSYIFLEVKRPLEEIYEIYNLLNRYNTLYNKFILNKDNRITTNVNGKEYVLLCKSEYKNKLVKKEILSNKLYVENNLSKLKRDNWIYLWSEKIDYLEYQFKHIKTKYLILADSFNYFVGMAEVAISYLVNTNISNKEKENRLVICHKRVNDNIYDYYNPLNIIIDNVTRDLAEYLKYIFYNDSYNDNLLKELVINNNFSSYEYYLLFARLLYPSLYFDIYENIVNNSLKEKEIIKIISLSDKYLDYVRYIFYLINTKTSIPGIDYL